MTEFQINVVENFHGIVSTEQGVSDEEFRKDAPQTPNVNGNVVLAVLEKNFRGLVVERVFRLGEIK
jgi:hypothetical protein